MKLELGVRDQIFSSTFLLLYYREKTKINKEFYAIMPQNNYLGERYG
jgi:hypothetical protein